MKSASYTVASDADQSAWPCTFSLAVKCEPVKEEPEWGERGVSAAAAAEGLYAGHVVKDELTIGPELIQQHDVAYGTQNALTVKELNLPMPQPAGGADAAPECTHACPGDAPCCNRSTELQHGLRSCFVRLERFPMKELCINKLFHISHNVPFSPSVRLRNLREITLDADLTKHAETLMLNKPHTCNICNNGSSYQFNVSMHKHAHIGGNVYSCDICDVQFKYKSLLIKHIQIHTGSHPYQCNVCKKLFTQKSGLYSHLHLHIGQKPHQCDVCKKRFTRKYHLTRHIPIHIDQKQYQCDVCSKRFAQKCTLYSHVKTHIGQKLYHCDICKKRFTRSYHLERHIHTHTGKNPYKCKVCNKRFIQKYNLTRHIRIHTDSKLYQCNVCNKWFTRKRHLSTHIRIHTVENNT